MFSCLGFLTVHANVWYNCQTRYLQVMMVNCNLASSCQYSTYIMGILWTDVKKIAESLQFPDFLIKYVKRKVCLKRQVTFKIVYYPQQWCESFPLKERERTTVKRSGGSRIKRAISSMAHTRMPVWKHTWSEVQTHTHSVLWEQCPQQ